MAWSKDDERPIVPPPSASDEDPTFILGPEGRGPDTAADDPPTIGREQTVRSMVDNGAVRAQTKVGSPIESIALYVAPKLVVKAPIDPRAATLPVGGPPSEIAPTQPEENERTAVLTAAAVPPPIGAGPDREEHTLRMAAPVRSAPDPIAPGPIAPVPPPPTSSLRQLASDDIPYEIPGLERKGSSRLAIWVPVALLGVVTVLVVGVWIGRRSSTPEVALARSASATPIVAPVVVPPVASSSPPAVEAPARPTESPVPPPPAPEPVAAPVARAPAPVPPPPAPEPVAAPVARAPAPAAPPPRPLPASRPAPARSNGIVRDSPF